MNTLLSITGWGTPREFSDEQLPGLSFTERRCRDKLNELAAPVPEKSRKREGSKANEFHYSILPPEAQAVFIQKYPEIIFKDDLKSSSKSIDGYSDEGKNEDLWDYLSRKSTKEKEDAEIKFQAVLMYDRLCSNGWKKTDAKEAVVSHFADKIKISFGTLGRWVKRVEGVDQSNWLPMLVSNKCGRVVAAECSPEAFDFIKADYLRLCKPTWSSCYERLERATKEHDWTIPSAKTLLRKLEREVHPDLIVLLREGEDAYKKTLLPQERDRSIFHALEAVNGDGYHFFKYVQFESGEVCQPVCWFWQDIYSGKLLAWRLDVSENKDMIRLSIGDLIERYGIPKHFWIDNTRAAANKDVTGGVKNRYRFKVMDDEPLGLIPQLGAEIHWATPGHGQAKPVERAFGIGGIGEYTDKHPKFEGRGTKNNPISIAEFEEALASEVAAFNARPGRRSKVANGRSYDAVFNESYQRHPIKKATKEQRALWLLAPETVRANRNNGSITVMNNRYWSEELSQHKGQKLVARFDPANMHAGVIVYTLDGRRVCEAECVLSAGFNDRNAARDVAKENKRRKRNLREIQKSELRITAREAADKLPLVEQPATPKTKFIEPIFTKKALEKQHIDDDKRFEAAIEILKTAKKESLL